MAPKRPPTTERFTRFLRLLTLATTPPVAIALLEVGRTIGAFAATALTIAVVGGVVGALGARVRFGFQDRPRSRWLGAFVVPIFDTIWCAFLFSPITTGLFALAAFPLAFLPPSRAQGVLSLAAITQAGALLGLLLATYGVFVRRRWVRVRRIDVPIDRLPAALDGYRIAHLSDLHIGSLARAREGRRWVAHANALNVDLVAVTGDLVSTGSHFHDEVVDVLSALAAPDGVFACLGNHDYYDADALCVRLAARGVRVLRNERVIVTREGARLVVAGVEDLWRGQVDLASALADRPPEAPTVLLAHNPELFPAAAASGVDLTLSGHIHAGQVSIPFLTDRWSLGRLSSRFAAGLFRDGRARLFVHAGLGTTGPAIRFGAAPEVVELTLRPAV